MSIIYRKAKLSDITAVTDLLCLLYDGEGLGLSRDELLSENEQLFADINQVFYLAFDGDIPVGISHGSLRREYVNGANDGCKGYLEAIYVLPEYRKNGIAKELVSIIERWAGLHGCREFASDCLLSNAESYSFHLSIGFKETERNIFFLKEITPNRFDIREIDTALREKVQPIVDESWSAPYMVVGGKLWDTRVMPGFAAVSQSLSIETTSPLKPTPLSETCEILGYLLYDFHDGICEIMALESIAQNIGVATALIEKVKETAKISGASPKAETVRVTVVTTNDNTNAIRFYQRRGFSIRTVRLSVMDAARLLKPSIPLIGDNGIPLRDEIEFEIEVQ